jgi:hypothetical protein
METLKSPIKIANGNVYNVLDVMNIMESGIANTVTDEVEMLLAA